MMLITSISPFINTIQPLRWEPKKGPSYQLDLELFPGTRSYTDIIKGLTLTLPTHVEEARAMGRTLGVHHATITQTDNNHH